jgi:hypothetical protein
MFRAVKPSTTGKTSKNQSTGIYADIQNLQDIARDVLGALIGRWPDEMPPPSKLNLYVRADHVHLWRVWATHAFPGVEVTVKGVQHYTLAATKNAADMAIAVDAISDFNHERVSHVAVVSDDSDFISLYAKLAEESNDKGLEGTDRLTPFMWVLTDRTDTKSALLQEFFPQQYIHIVDRFAMFDNGASDVASERKGSTALRAVENEENALTSNGRRQKTRTPRESNVTERIALQLIRDMPVGKFKSTDCQQIIRSNFPGHQLAGADGPAFGIIFRRDLLPYMEKRGVQELGSQRPRQYEMTLEAKKSLARF